MRLKKKLDEANLKINELKERNSTLNKNLIQAIQTIKISCFSFELNHNETE